MSYTELHFGKLKILNEELSDEAFKKFLKQNKGLYADDLKEKLEDSSLILVTQGDWRGKNLYAFHKNTLYEFLEHKQPEDAEFLHETEMNNEGTIDFTYLFYNGGTCFEEMLEEGLEKINK